MIDQARVVVIGGGVVGCGVLYHLAKMGWTDVALVEKNELTSGSTWHAAGLIGQLRSSRNVTRMIQYSVDLYKKLEEETGQATGWEGVGSLRIASSKDRLKELKKASTMGRSFGLDVQMLTPAETKEIFPIITLDRVEGSAYLASDGYVDPSMLTRAMAKGARDLGATIIRHTQVTGITVKNGAVTEVVTDKGTIRCDYVVNAAGMWARQIGLMAGVNVPVIPIEHQYMVTESVENLPLNMPVMRDPDNMIYYRNEVDGLVMGGFEPNPIPWSVNGAPWKFVSELLEPNFDQFEQLSERAIFRTPCLETAGVRQLINGPDGYSPDGAYVLGLAPELHNFHVAAGMNCYGIAGGGGVGRMVAEWIINGEPSLDLWSLDIRRFGSAHNRSKSFVAIRSLEYYPKHYTIAWPMYQNKMARGLRRSPLYETLKAKNAVFTEKSGWERISWFAPEGDEPVESMTFDRPNWHEPVAREVKALSEGVGLLDQASFGKIEVRGPDALELLEHLCTRKIGKSVGSITYTQMCNARGGIECDLTVARLAEDLFYIVTGTSFPGHDINWIKRNTPEGCRAIATEVSGSRTVINVGGPKSRELLCKVSDDDWSHEGFKFARCREVHIGYAPAWAMRVSYHGELGWELHIPTEYGAYAYETLWEAGQELGVTDFGYRALDSCRLEKGYYYWSGDITPDYNPIEVGLPVSFKKGDFIGREALLKIKEKGPKERMCFFTIDAEVQLFGSEPIIRDDKVLGIVTSGDYGHRVGKTVAYGYVPAREAMHDDYVIAAFGEQYPAKRHDGAIFDPERKRILA